jgi:hypothetical protein
MVRRGMRENGTPPLVHSVGPDGYTRPGWTRTAVAVIAFAVAMGYVEAAVVVDLRAALGLPLPATFPLTVALGPTERLALIEIGREAATLVMLVGIGLIAGRGRWEWLAWTAVAFGVWDIAYYGWLWVFAGWPASISDWDLLFLIPVPWIGPVLAPGLVSAALILFGLVAGGRYRAGRDPRIRRRHIVAGTVGAGLVVLSFTLDAPRIIDGGLPGWFPWPLFVAGLVVAIAGAVEMLRDSGSEAMRTGAADLLRDPLPDPLPGQSG